jgi:hypothetical protein
MKGIINANEVLSQEEFDRFRKMLEVEFPAVYQAYLKNIKTMKIINDFIEALTESEKPKEVSK